MPAIYDLPRANNMWDQQEVDRYNKLPFWLAMQQAKFYPQWQFRNKLVGKINWQPNMGSTMKGVILEPSPIGRTFFNPNPITQSPKKDLVSQYERTNTAVVRRHLFESPQFHFLPGFQDFRKKQVQMAQTDLSYQITNASDMFIRGYMFHYAPYVWICGKSKDADGNFELVNAPMGDPSDDQTTGKSTNWLQFAVSQIGQTRDGGTLGLKNMAKLLAVFRNDIQAPAFEGMVNTPKDNETIKGNYVLNGDGEVYQNLTFDNHVLIYKDLNRDLLNDEFSGKILGKIVYKSERFPIRIAADGTCPPPQLYVANAEAFNQYETIPNPDFVKAPFAVADMMGDGSYESINVGPPPAEFASGKISEEKFNKLFWNGEVRITDNLLVNYGNNVLDTNKYGEYLQLISSVVLGITPVNRRYHLPVIYRRWRVDTN